MSVSFAQKRLSSRRRGCALHDRDEDFQSSPELIELAVPKSPEFHFTNIVWKNKFVEQFVLDRDETTLDVDYE